MNKLPDAASKVSAPAWMGVALAVSAAVSGCASRSAKDEAAVPAKIPAAVEKALSVTAASAPAESPVHAKDLRVARSTAADGSTVLDVSWTSVDSDMATVGYCPCRGSVIWIADNMATKPGENSVRYVLPASQVALVDRASAGKEAPFIWIIAYRVGVGSHSIEAPVPHASK